MTAWPRPLNTQKVSGALAFQMYTESWGWLSCPGCGEHHCPDACHASSQKPLHLGHKSPYHITAHEGIEWTLRGLHHLTAHSFPLANTQTVGPVLCQTWGTEQEWDKHSPGSQVNRHYTAHQESVSSKAQQPRLIAVQMDPKQETSNAFAMRTKPCQVFPDPLSIFYFHHVNGHSKIYILNMSKRLEVIPF